MNKTEALQRSTANDLSIEG